MYPLREGEVVMALIDYDKDWKPDEDWGVGFRMWACRECGKHDVGGADELFAHLKEHRANDDFEEASNYFGE